MYRIGASEEGRRVGNPLRYTRNIDQRIIAKNGPDRQLVSAKVVDDINTRRQGRLQARFRRARFDRWRALHSASEGLMSILIEATDNSVVTLHGQYRQSNGNRFASAKDSVDAVVRALDVSAALMLLVLLAPLLLCIILAIVVEDSGKILFSQKRVGKDGRPFACLKFRTMVPDAEDRLAEILAADEARCAEWRTDRKLRDDPRVTRLGRILRRTSLDELPQLLNVLRGEMSLVGPRPIVPGEVPLYGRYIGSYYAVRPGLSGLWQVSGRNDVSYKRRIAFDVYYERRRSLPLYLIIIMKTPGCLLLARGCY